MVQNRKKCQRRIFKYNILTEVCCSVYFRVFDDIIGFQMKFVCNKGVKIM